MSEGYESGGQGGFMKVLILRQNTYVGKRGARGGSWAFGAPAPGIAHRHFVVRFVYRVYLLAAIRFQSEWFAEESDRAGDRGCSRFGTASCRLVAELRGSR